MSQRVVLDAQDVERCLRRIAHEILESNEGHRDLIILGIPTRGIHLANRIAQTISLIEPDYITEAGVLDITMYRDDLASKERKMATTAIPTATLDGKVVVLVDDVLFSGRTVRAALDAITDIGRPRQVKLAVLADRGHRELPIRPDFVGKNLPTSTKERVWVLLKEVDGDDQVVIGE
jgi:pyrimidine operon attenuation protein / uracil phosphoribosyltransferase